MIEVILLVPSLALRAGLVSLLDSEPSVLVLAAGSNFNEVSNFLPSADILILADSIPTVEIRQYLDEEQDKPSILILSDDPDVMRRFWEILSPSWGVLSTDSSLDELVSAIQALSNGLVVATPSLIETTLNRQVVKLKDDSEPIVDSLTEREIEVLQQLALGFSNKQIASRLFISEHTVKFHLSSLYGKLGASNRAEAVRLGIRQGLVLL